MNKLSTRSLKKLTKVHPKLVRVVTRATELSSIDIQVTVGCRTSDENQKMVASQRALEDSLHLIQDQTGYSHAVDLMAFVDGIGCWEVAVYDQVVTAMKQAAEEQELAVVWGGAWTEGDIRSYSGTPTDAMNAHIDRQRSDNQRLSIDHLHFEMI